MHKRLYTIALVLITFKLSIGQIDSLKDENVYKRYNYPNGNIASEGYLKEEKPTGFWKSYYITGIKKSEGKWTNNKLDSIWIFYNQLGDTTEKISYFQGRKNGYHLKFFKNEVAIKELYLNGKRNGITYYLFGNGNIKKEIPFTDNKMHGIGFEYNIEGIIIVITRYRNDEIVVQENINRLSENGNREGAWKEFYSNGIIKEEKNYLNGRLNGYLKRYSQDGNLVTSLKYVNGEVDLSANEFDSNIEIKEDYNDQGNLTFQGSFKGSTPIGIHRYFNANGRVVSSKTYNIEGILTAEGVVLPNGWESGDWTYFFNSGKKKASGKFANGKKTGKWTYYYENGKVQQTGSYSAGKLTGNWKWYYNTGELLKEELYIYGKLDGESIEYSILGEIIAKGNYVEGNKEGEWVYIVGDQKHIGKYTLGLKDGKWESYYTENNVLSFTGYYLQGNPDGKHVYFYLNQTIKEEQHYSEGEKVRSWPKYNERGDIVIVVQYRNGEVYKINGIKVKLNQS